MGGLDANWTKTVYGNNKAATSKSSLASSDAMTLDIELMDVPGEFDADVGADVVAAEREGKTNKGMKAKTTSKVSFCDCNGYHTNLELIEGC